MAQRGCGRGSTLDFDECERNVTDHYFGVLDEGYVELRKQRVIVDVVLFANQIQTRNAEMAMRTRIDDSQ